MIGTGGGHNWNLLKKHQGVCRELLFGWDLIRKFGEEGSRPLLLEDLLIYETCLPEESVSHHIV